MDTFSKSDPFVVLYQQVGNNWVVKGVTELIHDTLNPEFVKKIMVEFHFERTEIFKVDVFDSDNDANYAKNLEA